MKYIDNGFTVITVKVNMNVGTLKRLKVVAESSCYRKLIRSLNTFA